MSLSDPRARARRMGWLDGIELRGEKKLGSPMGLSRHVDADWSGVAGICVEKPVGGLTLHSAFLFKESRAFGVKHAPFLMQCNC